MKALLTSTCLMVGASLVWAQEQPKPAAPPAAQKEVQKLPAGQLTLRGKILRMQGNDQFVVRGNDNREFVFYTNPETRYKVRGAAGRFADLQVGSDVNVIYGTRDDRYYVNSVTVGEAAPAQPGAAVEPAQPAQPEVRTVNGTVVRVVGTDQVVVKEGEKEIIIYVTPQTKYSINDQPGRFTDLQPGSVIRADYEIRDRRPLVRSIIGRRR